VLQRKLHSLPNVDVITSALTSEVKGDGQKVSGLIYKIAIPAVQDHRPEASLLPDRLAA